MKAFYSDTFELPLPIGHRFPISKYRRLRERLQQDHPHEPVQLFEAPAVTREQLALVHTDDYLDRLFQGQLSALEQRRIGFPWSPGMVERCLHSAGGTLAAALAAGDERCAVHLAGGTHHAFPDSGQGFCVFNDVAIAIRTLRAADQLRRAVIIDCDVHQGNGTAAVFADDETVFTFSMHGANNFPFRKHEGDLDIALSDGTGDDEYLTQLAEALDRRLPLAGADRVFYLAGADPYEGDRYGKLALSKAGLAERDRLVMAACLERCIPLTIVMAGGYAEQIDDIVDVHAQTVVLAARTLG